MKHRYRRSGYDVLDKWDSLDFDEATREVVAARLTPPPIRFFSADEVRLLEAIVERIVPQKEKIESERIAIVPWLDEKLHLDQREGYRYDNLPPFREAWRSALRGIDESARLMNAGLGFEELSDQEKDRVLRSVQEDRAPGDVWKTMSAARFFTALLLRGVVGIYYSHPFAWSEVGYSGPSSPRGHVRKWEGGVDPWEAPEC